METYLVGGAVRDELLGLPVAERDWVVVGARPAELLDAGYRSVGKDFPVFLHPETSEEYALARTERKTGRGHGGFECETESVTLEQDLTRRDLTINAIAKAEDGRFIDPTGGLEDLENKRLRHISPAFREDPLRVLRVARFAAMLHEQGFTIDDATLALMQQMVADGEIEELTPERVQTELDKALGTDSPAVFFDVIERVGAGAVLWPELDRRGIRLLDDVSKMTADVAFRLAAVVIESGPLESTAILERYRHSNRRIEFVDLARRFVPRLDASLTGEETVDVLYEADAFRQSERFDALVRFTAIVETARGNGQAEAQAKRWRTLRDELAQIDRQSVDGDLEGPAVGTAIRRARIAHLRRSG